MRRFISLLLTIALCAGCMTTAIAESTAREAFINQIIATAEDTYNKANGKLQRAQYAGDIYVCKNYTVYLFRQNRDDFRMAQYPNVELVIPDNLPSSECTTYAYGLEWKDVSAARGESV